MLITGPFCVWGWGWDGHGWIPSQSAGNGKPLKSHDVLMTVLAELSVTWDGTKSTTGGAGTTTDVITSVVAAAGVNMVPGGM